MEYRTFGPSVLEHRTRISPSLASILHNMLDGSGSMYRAMARIALAGLEREKLMGIYVSSERYLLHLRTPGQHIAAVQAGAVFQPLVAAGQAEQDVVGVIITEDKFRGGAMVLAHEIAHFWNGWRVSQLLLMPCSAADLPFVKSAGKADIKRVRSRFLDELAARHVAYLCETYREGRRFASLPPGALLGCAVKIASYPEIYDASGVLADVEIDQLYALMAHWFPLLLSLKTMPDEFTDGQEHRAWLHKEASIALLGPGAPRPPLEGTL